MSLNKIFLFSFAITLGFFSATSVLAWTGASAGFPAGNASAPLNVSSAGQIKSGILTTGGLSAPTICIGVDCRSAWPSGGTSQWTTSGSTIYYNGGNVGIGTAGPLATLDIVGTNSAQDLIVRSPTTRMEFYAYSNGNNYIESANAANTASAPLIFTGYSGTTGTFTFSGALTVTGGIADSAGTRMDAAGGWVRTYGNTGWYNQSYNGGWYMQDTTWIRSYGSKAVYMDTGFDTGAASGVGCTGSLGGGYTFRVCGTEAVNGTLTVTAGATYGTNIYSTTQPAVYGHSDSSYGVYGVSGTSWAGVFVGPYGVVAENSTGALYSELETSGYGLLTNQPVQAPAFYYSSDQRLKKNIAAIASSTALQDILALQPVTFNWINPVEPTTTQIGFIAQQVEKVVPELVTTDASSTMKAVDYARVTPLLVGAVQQQQAQIDAQQKEIDELKAEVAALKAKQ